jgi:hypothetical protein
MNIDIEQAITNIRYSTMLNDFGTIGITLKKGHIGNVLE